MNPIDRAKVEKLRDDVLQQKEQAVARANALGGALDALNAVLALKPDDPAQSDEPPAGG